MGRRHRIQRISFYLSRKENSIESGILTPRVKWTISGEPKNNNPMGSVNIESPTVPQYSSIRHWHSCITWMWIAQLSHNIDKENPREHLDSTSQLEGNEKTCWAGQKICPNIPGEWILWRNIILNCQQFTFFSESLRKYIEKLYYFTYFIWSFKYSTAYCQNRIIRIFMQYTLRKRKCLHLE